MKAAEEEQQEEENEVSGEGGTAQTLSLEAPELKEMEHLNASAEQVSHCIMHCECACSWEVNRKAGRDDEIF